jgi:biotin-(acetyl-CoA carboxylase) ligase
MKDGSQAPDAPRFPPLLHGLASGPADPFAVALARARHGVDPGLLVWSLTEERLRTALVLTPEEGLDRAVAALPACMVGLRDALGVLAPAETAVQFDWAGTLRINGAVAGGVRAAASMPVRGDVPRWMAVGWDLRLRLPPGAEGGRTPEATALIEEGCGEVAPVDLLEAYARHALHWLNRLEERGGRAALGADWAGLLWGRGETARALDGGAGTFLGVDEDYAMLLKAPSGIRRIPLTAVVERA